MSAPDATRAACQRPADIIHAEFERLGLDFTGERALEVLRLAGYTIVDAAKQDAWRENAEREITRLRDLARAAIEASGLRALLVEIRFDDQGVARLIVCDPVHDEHAMACRVAKLLGCLGDDLKRGETPGPAPKTDGAT